jgi:hypothetical protein
MKKYKVSDFKIDEYTHAQSVRIICHGAEGRNSLLSKKLKLSCGGHAKCFDHGTREKAELAIKEFVVKQYFDRIYINYEGKLEARLSRESADNLGLNESRKFAYRIMLLPNGKVGLGSQYSFFETKEQLLNTAIKYIENNLEEKEGMEFTKKDLKNGMRVITASEGEFVYLTGQKEGGVFCKTTGGYNDESEYRDDLTVPGSSGLGYKIIKVYTINSRRHLLSKNPPEDSKIIIWERKEKTPQEIKIDELEQTIKDALSQIEDIKNA